MCLLGTNVSVPLGLMTPDTGVELRGGNQSCTSEATEEAKVHLVGAICVPSRCTVVVCAQVQDSVKCAQTVWFEPGVTWLTESGLVMEDSLLEPDGDGLVSVVIHNPNATPRKLPDALEIGEAGLCVGSEQLTDATSKNDCDGAAQVVISIS